ncbi:MAG TPA: hypothetical protein DEB10_14325 [Ruminococcaceae bacterium]|nr:hypothetical protein [Oscillospiraceae bacterium]
MKLRFKSSVIAGVSAVMLAFTMLTSVLLTAASAPTGDSSVFTVLQDFDDTVAGTQATAGDGISGDDWGNPVESAAYTERKQGNNWLTVDGGSRFHHWLWFSDTPMDQADHLSFYIENNATDVSKFVLRVKNLGWAEVALSDNYNYKLMSTTGEITDRHSTWAIELPAGFKGFVLVPPSAFASEVTGIVRMGFTFEVSPADSSYAIDDVCVVKDVTAFSAGFAPEPQPEPQDDYILAEDFNDKTQGPATLSNPFGALPLNPLYGVHHAPDDLWLEFDKNASEFYTWISPDSPVSIGENDYAAVYLKTVSQSSTTIRAWLASDSKDHHLADPFSYRLLTQDGLGAVQNSTWNISIPANFEGYLILPRAAFIDEGSMTQIARIALQFNQGTAGRFAVDNFYVIHDLDVFAEEVSVGSAELDSGEEEPEPEPQGDYILAEDFSGKTQGPATLSNPFGALPLNPLYGVHHAPDDLWLEFDKNASEFYTWISPDSPVSIGKDDYAAVYIKTVSQSSTNIRAWLASGSKDHHLAESFSYRLLTQDGLGAVQNSTWHINIPANFEGYLILPRAAFIDESSMTQIARIALQFHQGTVGRFAVDNFYVIHDLDVFTDEISVGSAELDSGEEEPPPEPERGTGSHLVWENFNSKDIGGATSSWWGTSFPNARYGVYLDNDKWFRFQGGNPNLHFGFSKEGAPLSFQSDDWLSFYIETGDKQDTLLRPWIKDEVNSYEPKDSFSYKLVTSGNNTVTDGTGWVVTIPAGFKGWVLLPWDSFKDIPWEDGGAGSVPFDCLTIFDLNLMGSVRSVDFGIDDLAVVYDLNAFIAGLKAKPPRTPDAPPEGPEYEDITVPYQVWEDFEDKEPGPATTGWWGNPIPGTVYVSDANGKHLEFNGGDSNSHFGIDKSDTPVTMRPGDYLAFYLDTDIAADTRMLLYLNDGIDSGMKASETASFTYWTLQSDGMLIEHPQSQIMSFSSGFSGMVIVPSEAFLNSPFYPLLKFDINLFTSDSQAKYKFDDLTIVYEFDTFVSDTRDQWGVVPPPEDILIERNGSDATPIGADVFENLQLSGSRLTVKIKEDWDLYTWKFDGVDITAPASFVPLIQTDFTEKAQILKKHPQLIAYFIKTDSLPGQALFNIYLEDVCMEPYLYSYQNGKLKLLSYNPYVTEEGYAEVLLKEGGIYVFTDEKIQGADVDNGNWDAEKTGSAPTGDGIPMFALVVALPVSASLLIVMKKRKAGAV